MRTIAPRGEKERKVILLEPLLELVIFARENAGDERPEIERACRAAERKIEELRMKRRRRESRNARERCLVCDGRAKEMLCWSCREHAPDEIRNAFAEAVGLDGMRGAVEKIKVYAAGKGGGRSGVVPQGRDYAGTRRVA